MIQHEDSSAMMRGRMSICNDCEHLSKVKVCNICKCFMPIKSALPFLACPDGKWGEETLPDNGTIHGAKI